MELASGTFSGGNDAVVSLFSESNTRFVCEVEPANAAAFEQQLAGVPLTKLGNVTGGDQFIIAAAGNQVIDSDLATLKEAWQAPLRW